MALRVVLKPSGDRPPVFLIAFAMTEFVDADSQPAEQAYVVNRSPCSTTLAPAGHLSTPSMKYSCCSDAVRSFRVTSASSSEGR